VGISTVKYLGLHLIGGKDFKLEFTVAKMKCYGGFNNIKTTVGRQVNEITLLHLIKSYCLPRLLYSCEIWPLITANLHERDVSIGYNTVWSELCECIRANSLQTVL